ncbi:restriction endonuclease subunit S [Ornithinimicrobium ciconiae]|uniref:restriction endonuclease subunit S n=1 Tax=Ornithinimicrobium ciconiae TaxID=2594265 RepID=UPI0013FD0E0F|nr:restriction endonuclease subunit S [Ornithinimicrobium ciconiae]
MHLDDDQVMWFRPGELRALDLQPNDVVIVEGGAGYGRSGLIRDGHSGWGFQNSIVRVRPFPDLSHGPFVDYALQSALAEGRIALVASTATIPHFTAEKVAAFPIPRPPLVDQRAIADYLDRETAEIDLLIEKQTALIDRLRERRRAMISSMVVGGSSTVGGSQERPVALDQQLSALPSGWGRVRLSRLATSPVTAGVDFSAAMLSEGHIRYVRTTDIATLASLTSADKAVGITYEMAGTSLVRRDDLLFTRSGSLGTSYLHQSDEVMAYAGYLVRLRPDTGRCLPRFLGWWSQSDDHLDQIAVGATRSTIENFSASRFSAMRVPLPPLEEQQRIVNHLDHETATNDEVIAKTARFIELTKERRSALITAAVTGQVDVTGRGAA